MNSGKKKKTAVVAAVILLAGMLTACGKDKAYLSGIKASDYVTPGEYKGIEVTANSSLLSDDYVDFSINYLRSQHATIVEAPDKTVVENGDIANIDYAGYKDGVAFDGGTAAGQNLMIGSGSFIPGFEEGLIGVKVGETVSLDLTFPEDYSNSEELAGADVTFEVTVNSISTAELPELTDEFVQSLGLTDCNTVDELKDYVYQVANDSYENSIKRQISQKVTENSIFEEPPEEMVERYCNILVENMATTVADSYGVDLNTFMSAQNMSEEEYMQTFREDAKTLAKQYILFQAISDIEGLALTKEQMEQAIAEEGYQVNDESREEVEEAVMLDVVMDFLYENAVITEAE